MNTIYNKYIVTWYLALKGNKILETKKDIIVAFNVRRNLYTLWLRQDKRLPVFLESCNSRVNLDFKLNILEEQSAITN